MVGGDAGMVGTLEGCQGHQVEQPLESSQLAGQKRPRLELSGVHGEHVSLGGGGGEGGRGLVLLVVALKACLGWLRATSRLLSCTTLLVVLLLKEEEEVVAMIRRG